MTTKLIYDSWKATILIRLILNSSMDCIVNPQDGVNSEGKNYLPFITGGGYKNSQPNSLSIYGNIITEFGQKIP